MPQDPEVLALTRLIFIKVKQCATAMPTCFPFTSKKPRRRTPFASVDSPHSPLPRVPYSEQKIVGHPLYSQTSTFTSQAESVTIDSSSVYDAVRDLVPTGTGPGCCHHKSEFDHTRFVRK